MNQIYILEMYNNHIVLLFAMTKHLEEKQPFLNR